jgi:glycine betaine/proline transport system substrate-binding protein
MEKLKSTISILSALLILSFGFAACGGQEQSEESEGEDKSARLVYVNWAEGVAYTNLAKNVLEEKMGYEVEITTADVGPAYTSVAQGDYDAFMETWLPVLHADYYDRFKDDIVDLGHVYKNTKSGLVVPTYLEDINSISDLGENADMFGGDITGIDAGAGIMSSTEQVIESYGLDMNLVSSSGPAMTSALSRAVQNEEPIVVTGWDPHWMFGRFDLKFLEQDGEQIWGAGNIHIMGRTNLESEKPELAQFLRNMEFTTDELADLMLHVNESENDVEEATMEWMMENEDVVEDWIPASGMASNE